MSEPTDNPAPNPAPSPEPAPGPAPEPGPAPAPEPSPAPAPEASPAPAPEATGAPESYADFKLPEGMSFSDENKAKFVEFAKGANLSQEAAQQAVDMGAHVAEQAIADYAQTIVSRNEGWLDESKKLDDLGGKNFQDTLATCARAIDGLGSEKLRSALNETGLGNHPEMIKFMHAVGQAMTEGKFNPTDSGADEKTAAEILYGPKS